MKKIDLKNVFLFSFYSKRRTVGPFWRLIFCHSERLWFSIYVVPKSSLHRNSPIECRLHGAVDLIPAHMPPTEQQLFVCCAVGFMAISVQYIFQRILKI